MCWMAAVPIAMAGAQALGQQNSEAKAQAAQIKAMRQQSREQLKAMNIQNADLTLQQRGALEEATDELTGQNLQKVQAMGAIRATIGESNLEGASFERIKRVSEGDYIREANKVTDNYHRDYAAIFQQQVGAFETAKSQIEARNKAEPKRKSVLERVLDPLAIMGSAAANSYMAGQFDSPSGKAPISAAKGTKTGR